MSFHILCYLKIPIAKKRQTLIILFDSNEINVVVTKKLTFLFFIHMYFYLQLCRTTECREVASTETVRDKICEGGWGPEKNCTQRMYLKSFTLKEYEKITHQTLSPIHTRIRLDSFATAQRSLLQFNSEYCQCTVSGRASERKRKWCAVSDLCFNTVKNSSIQPEV